MNKTSAAEEDGFNRLLLHVGQLLVMSVTQKE